MVHSSLLIEQHKKDIHSINEQRRRWLAASSIVCMAIIGLIFGWDWLFELHQKTVWWVIVSCIIIICMNWWYWTMKIIFTLLKHQSDENEIVNELLVEIKELRNLLIDIKDCNCIDK